MHNLTLSFLLILSILVHSNAYVFKCLDECECDTDDEAIHCHDNPDRERVVLPKSRLSGFTVLALTKNDIKSIPSEELLLEKFPDLKAVDLEGNENFDCSTLDQYSKITVMSDCGKTSEQLEEEHARLPTTVEPTENCDLECVAKKRTKQLHEYIKRLWEMIKEKAKKLAKKSGLDTFIEDIGNFFSDVREKIANFKF